MALTKVKNRGTTGIETDLQPVKSDITALALREATNESSAAFNLPNQHIDTFSTDTLGTKTNVSVTNGMVSSLAYAGGWDGNTIFLVDGVDASNPFRDLINDVDPAVNDLNSGSGTPARDTGTNKWGSNAVIDMNGGNLQYDVSNSNTGWDGSGAYTIEFWMKHSSIPGNRKRYWGFRTGNNTHMTYGTDYGSSADFNGYSEVSGTGHEYPVTGTFDLTTGNSNWNHFRYVRGGGAGSTHYYFFNGTLVGSRTQTSGNADLQTINSGKFDISGRITSSGNGTEHIDAYYTDFMIHKGAKSTATFSVPSEKASFTASATGTAIQAANTVGSAKTKVGGTILYKDNSGTATIGTDLKVYFSCNGGSAWTEASSYNAITPVYSTGIKQIRLGQTTCTSGTDVRYKVEWANQASGSKETQLHGIGINY